MMTGIQLILATINITFCESNYNLFIDDVSKPPRYNALKEAINGRHLKVGTYNNRPSSWTETDKDGKIIGRGVVFDILNIISEKLNFTYDILTPKNNYEVGGTTFNGSLVGMLIDREIDVAAAMITSDQGLEGLISFSSGFDFTDWVIMYKKPQIRLHNVYVLPTFQAAVWMEIFLATIIYGICLTLLTRLRATLMNDDKGFISLPSSFSHLFRIVSEQDSKKPQDSMTRILLATWSLYVMLTTLVFKACMTAHMIVPLETLQIKSAEDFTKYNKSWIAARGGPIERFFLDPKAAEYDKFRSMIENKTGIFVNFDDRHSEYENILETKSVFIKESQSVFYFMYNNYITKKQQGFSEDECCTYVVAPNRFMTKQRGFAFPYDSNLKKQFDYSIKQILESGMYAYINRKYLAYGKVCVNTMMESRQLGHYNLITATSILLIGLASSLIVLLLEIIYKKLKKLERTPIVTNENMRQRYRIMYGYDSQDPVHDVVMNTRPMRRQIVNGREYYRTITIDGETRFIPMKTLSALLYEKYNA